MPKGIVIPVRQYWTLLRTYLKPQWPSALLLALLLFSHIGLRLIVPQILRAFIDTALSGGELAVLLRTAALFVGVAIGSQAIGIATTWVGENVAWRATNQLRQDTALHVLKLDPSFHKAHTSGELISRVDGDVNTLASFFSQLAISMVGNAVLLTALLTLLFAEDWRLGLSMLVFSGLALVILMVIRGWAIPQWKNVREQMVEFYGFVGEQLAGTEDIRANGASSYALRRFLQMVRERLEPQVRSGLGSYGTWMSSTTLFGVSTALVYGLCAYLWQSGQVSIGTLYMIIHYTKLMRDPIAQIRTQLTDLQQAEASISRIQSLLDTRSVLIEPEQASARSLPEGPLAVRFDKVSFGYDEGELVLKDVSFALEPGHVLGLLGRTGSSKTTLARLLLRMYDVVQGEITLCGLSPRETTLFKVRQRVSMVTQNVELFQASVRQNLTLFDADIPDRRLHGVIEDLGLSEWLQSLPHGLNTQLASGGSNLSAGQAQLLAFARTFLADPGLLILDEASSRLDPATERVIERAVDKLLSGRTGLVIAHRLATVRRADEILILDEGRVLEHGSRIALIDDPRSHFARLLDTGLEEMLA